MYSYDIKALLHCYTIVERAVTASIGYGSAKHRMERVILEEIIWTIKELLSTINLSVIVVAN